MSTTQGGRKQNEKFYWVSFGAKKAIIFSSQFSISLIFNIDQSILIVSHIRFMFSLTKKVLLKV